MRKRLPENGLREPITIFEDKILEGRNRYRAVLKANHKYKLKEGNFRPYTGTKPLEFVISANVHRRHLDTSQRALTAARLVTTKLGDNQHNGGISTAAAAKMLNVSEALVKDAKNLLEKAAPELLKKVQEGKKRISAVWFWNSRRSTPTFPGSANPQLPMRSRSTATS